MIIGSKTTGSAGESYIFFGGDSPDNISDVTLVGVSAGDNFGDCVGCAGDVNNDGFNDVLVSGNKELGIFSGKVYLFFGGDPMNAQSDWQAERNRVDELFSVGDMNGDGGSEFIIGRRGYNYPSGFSAFAEVWTRSVGVKESGSSTPRENTFSAFPNPFYESTTLEYQLKDASPVELQIYDKNGSLVRTLIGNETKNPGKHRIIWDGKDNTGKDLPNGVYFCKLKIGKRKHEIRVKKIISIK